MPGKISIAKDRHRKKPWRVCWQGEFDPATGKRRYYSRYFRTKAEAENFRAEQHHKFSRGVSRDKPAVVSLGDFCRDWVHTRKNELRPASLEAHENTISRLKKFFGKDCTLCSITPQKAAAFIAEQKSMAKGHEGRELSDASREQVKRNSKCLFNGAVEWGILATNPFTMRLKKLTPKRWHRVTVDEYHALLEAAQSLRIRVMYALLYTTGARLSEAFSLTWSDVDFENGRVMIANREGTATLPPFNIKDYEARRIPLPKHTIDLLTEWQAQAPEGVPYILLTKDRFELVKAKWQELRKAGKSWRNRYMINNVLRNFKGHYKRAGIKPVGKLTIHTLRKCAGQNWADHLSMHVVKELMGHSSISTTQIYYTQVDADHEAKAARVINHLLNTSKETQTSKESCAEFAPEANSEQLGGKQR